MNTQIKGGAAALALATLLALTGCGTSTVSKDISADGRAGEVIFPDIEKSAWLKEGTFPDPEDLRRIAPGMTKDQLYTLIGRPHFREGLVGVREWDYIFNFRQPGGGVMTCQWKAIYDTELRAQTFHWQPAACADQLKVAAAPERVVERVTERVVERPPQERPAPPPPQRIELSADALFAFGRSGKADLLPQGRRELDALAAQLRGTGDAARLRITGHADRIGSAASNQRLSLARATTVRDDLVDAGVTAAAGATVVGRGSQEPKVQCAQSARAALIECLAPNRRVEIEVSGAR
ncbi:MAG: outer membrane protein assembly factor BamE [Comamonadaceae bacterium]|nr:MAG: outer membrane protein assembly factor BamE [Comamonadaceae bacterium]